MSRLAQALLATMRPQGLRIGDPLAGGFFAGIIDTTRPGSIIAEDAYQTGQRYMLVVSPKSLEETGLLWRTSHAEVTEAKSRWDGLSIQRALASATYPAFNYCAGLSYPDDGGSEWHLPTLDEMELIYRNLKPTQGANSVGNASHGGSGEEFFPPAPVVRGLNPSSDPDGEAYTSDDPTQTAALDFREGGSEALTATSVAYYSTATFCRWTGTQFFYWGIRASDGAATSRSISTSSGIFVRPVRRIPI